jgi:hypothetical protein
MSTTMDVMLSGAHVASCSASEAHVDGGAHAAPKNDPWGDDRNQDAPKNDQWSPAIVDEEEAAFIGEKTKPARIPQVKPAKKQPSTPDENGNTAKKRRVGRPIGSFKHQTKMDEKFGHAIRYEYEGREFE